MKSQLQYIKRNMLEVMNGGWIALRPKLNRLLGIIWQSVVVKWICGLPFLPIIIVVRLLAPVRVIKFCRLHSLKFGHFSANTELHLCDLDLMSCQERRKQLNLYFYGHKIVCNRELARMWARVISIFPAWLIYPLFSANRLILGHERHEVDIRSHSGRDMNNLLDVSSAHIKFSEDDERMGLIGLEAMGIERDASFVCVNFRDHAYFDNLLGPGKDARDSYRNSNIESFLLAAEELTKRGYYVVRMGAKVEKEIKTSNSRIIDYASGAFRSEFMDIYLGAKCTFAVSTATGWDGIPFIFRRPICFVNSCPLSYLLTSKREDLLLTKHHCRLDDPDRVLSLREIFALGVNAALNANDYEYRGIGLRDNTPEELLDVAIEMDERIKGEWVSDVDEEQRQSKFREVFNQGNLVAGKADLHGELRARYSDWFLRKNPSWLS